MHYGWKVGGRCGRHPGAVAGCLIPSHTLVAHFSVAFFAMRACLCILLLLAAGAAAAPLLDGGQAGSPFSPGQVNPSGRVRMLGSRLSGPRTLPRSCDLCRSAAAAAAHATSAAAAAAAALQAAAPLPLAPTLLGFARQLLAAAALIAAAALAALLLGVATTAALCWALLRWGDADSNTDWGQVGGLSSSAVSAAQLMAVARIHHG